jgi:ferredoxin
MAYIITQACAGVKDGACVTVCPVGCIAEGEDQFYINPDTCIDCGACVPVCPVSAIFSAETIPDPMRPYIFKNRAFFR